MAESNSNREPPVCPCGFFGSSQTSGLCSKCYKEKIERERNPTATHANSTPTSSPAVSSPAIATPVVPTNENLLSSPSNSNSTQTPVAEEAAKTQVQDANISSSETARTDASGVEAKAESERPVQKNKKRCFKCKARLELAFVEIGRCKCDYVFCEVHRLPEQHDCSYDHKEHGRKEAREKMVSPKKHVGTTLKRLDSDA